MFENIVRDSGTQQHRETTPWKRIERANLWPSHLPENRKETVSQGNTNN